MRRRAKVVGAEEITIFGFLEERVMKCAVCFAVRVPILDRHSQARSKSGGMVFWRLPGGLRTPEALMPRPACRSEQVKPDVRDMASHGCLTRMHVVRLLAPRIDGEDNQGHRLQRVGNRKAPGGGLRARLPRAGAETLGQ